MRRRRSGLLTFLLVAAVLLAVVGVILVSVYFYLRGSTELPTALPQEPWAAVEVEAISPPLALRTLAGEEEVDTVRAALSVGDLDSAYATLVFSSSLSDAERTGHLLLLAQHYISAEQGEKAAVCLQQVHSLIVLSPLLSDAARGDAALQAASIWHTLGREDAARLSLAQAEVVAEQSNYLRPAQQRDLWQRLAAAYGELEDAEKAAAAQQAADRRRDQPAQAASAPLLPEFLGDLLLSQEVEDMRLARHQRAVTLIEQWIALEGDDVAPEVADLAEFLRREDAARMAYFDQATVTEPQLAVQAAAAWERAAWLTLKYRIARGGFGLSLVPEWEENAPLIRTELAKAYEALFQLYGDQATALPSATDVDQAWVELLRQEILLGQLELYPDYPEDQLVERLQEAQERLRATRRRGFWVSSYVEDGKRFFTLVDQTADTKS